MSEQLAILGGIVALAAIGAGIYAALKVNLRRATVDIWREQAQALSARLETVEESDKECKSQLAAMKTANSLLIDRISGVEAVHALSSQTKAQHGEIMAALWALAAGRAP